MRKIYLFIIIIGFGALISSLILFSKDIALNPEENLASLVLGKRIQDSKITIYAVGDIMLDRGVEYMTNKEGKGDFKFPFLKIVEELKEADLLFGNLEGPISDKGIKVGSIYSFQSNPEVIEGLSYAGFDVLSLANNHMLDYGRAAFEDTMNILRDNEIDYIGAGFDENEAFSVKIKEVRGQKIGFLAYTDLGSQSWRAGEKKSGMAWIEENDIDKIKKDIQEEKKKVDILIISLHSGVEYGDNPTAFQENFSRACLEAGADIILGHHPHVVQKLEQYPEKKSEISNRASQNGWIAYSLGNFIFDQGFSEETMKGLLLEIVIINGKIKEVNPREFKISDYFQPYFSPQ